MLQIIKMDLYRLFRTKLTYILTGVLIIFTAVMMVSYGFLDFAIKNIDPELLGADNVQIINMVVPRDLGGYLTMFFFGNYSIVFIILFTVLFCSKEYSTGYIKNTAVNILPRYLTYFSKLIIAAGYSVVSFALLFLVVYGGCAIIGYTDVLNAAGVVKMILVQLLCNISLTSFIMMLFYVTRTTGVAMVAGLIYSTMGTLAYSLINMLAGVAFPKADIDFTKYTNLGNMLYHVNASASTGTYVRAVVVAVIFLALSSFLSCLAINKKDIN